MVVYNRGRPRPCGVRTVGGIARPWETQTAGEFPWQPWDSQTMWHSDHAALRPWECLDLLDTVGKFETARGCLRPLVVNPCCCTCANCCLQPWETQAMWEQDRGIVRPCGNQTMRHSDRGKVRICGRLSPTSGRRAHASCILVGRQQWLVVGRIRTTVIHQSPAPIPTCSNDRAKPKRKCPLHIRVYY